MHTVTPSPSERQMAASEGRRGPWDLVLLCLVPMWCPVLWDIRKIWNKANFLSSWHVIGGKARKSSVHYRFSGEIVLLKKGFLPNLQAGASWGEELAQKEGHGRWWSRLPQASEGQQPQPFASSFWSSTQEIFPRSVTRRLLCQRLPCRGFITPPFLAPQNCGPEIATPLLNIYYSYFLLYLKQTHIGFEVWIHRSGMQGPP